MSKKMKTNVEFEKYIQSLLTEDNIPPADESRKEKTVQMAVASMEPQKFRISLGTFVLNQLGFIKKRTIVLEVLCLAAFIWIIHLSNQYVTYWNDFIFLSIAAPIVMLVAVEDIARIYNQSMLEIETATRFSIMQILFSRMTILGTLDLFILICLSIFTATIGNTPYIHIMIYTVVPFLLMTVCILLLMKHCSGSKLMYGFAVTCIVWVILILLGNTKLVSIYAEKNLIFWGLSGAVALGMIIYECRKMIPIRFYQTD